MLYFAPSLYVTLPSNLSKSSYLRFASISSLSIGFILLDKNIPLFIKLPSVGAYVLY